jgi:ABC-type transport system involved in cytochrome c biogenesis ATPase subunit
MMRRLSRVEVVGLFGYAGHVLNFRADDPTILTGPNGVGKTQVLGLLQSTLKLDTLSISIVPFQSLRIVFSDGRGLFIERLLDPDAPVSLRLQAEQQGKSIGEPLLIVQVDEPAEHLPEHVQRLVDGRWYDTSIERILSKRQMERFYGVKTSSFVERFPDGAEIAAAVEGTNPIFIDTKRLDTPAFSRSDLQSGPGRSGGAGSARSASRTVSRIDQYIDELRVQVSEARRASVAETQSADLSFAVRALANAHERVNEPALRQRYSRVVEQYEDLTRNGLATGDVPVEFPNNTNPTSRRILDVFLDDWERRLRPLVPLNEKLTVLRRILDEKFATTGKSTFVSPQGRLGFQDRSQRQIRVASLSSGEQHLVALYTMLVFGAKAGSLVLIDEPEISMHAAWKHAFLRDITEVSELAELQVVLATHSSAIINGRWDLTEELLADADRVEREPTEDYDPDSVHDTEDWLV